MPWCGACARWWAPTAATPDGRCPACGRRLDHRVTAGARRPARAGAPGPDDVGFPWHLKLLAAAVVVYLAWRAAQLLGLAP